MEKVLLAREVKALAIAQYVMITGAWILVADEIRTFSGDFTKIGLWAWKGPYLAPYGIPWYISYRLFNSYGLELFVLSQWTIGFVGVTLLARHGWRNWLYGIIGGIVFFLWIDDMLYFTVASYGKWYTSLAALALKLPIGAPLYVWEYIFHTSGGELLYANIARYILLGILTLAPLLRKIM